MKRFIAITIIVLFLTSVIPGTCLPGSLTAQEGAVKTDDQKHDKDTVTDKIKKDSADEKTKDKGLKEPEYDMDFEVDPENERCQYDYQFNC